MCSSDLAVVEEVLAVHVVVDEDQVHHVAVVGPRAKLHGAVLPVEGEEGDVHGAGGLVAGRRAPHDGAVRAHDGLGHERALKSSVGTSRLRGGGVQTGQRAREEGSGGDQSRGGEGWFGNM